MSFYNTPTNLPTLTDPLGVDLAIQLLQTELATELSWLEYSFGRAYLGREEQEKGKDYIYPAVYKGLGNYQDASPNDNLKSASFFVVDGDYSYSEYDINLPNKMSVPVSLIVWGDLSKLSQTFDEHFGSVLLQDILRVVRNFQEAEVDGVSDNENDVFSEFSVREENPSLFYYPYFCYRISLKLAIQEDCEANIDTALTNYKISLL